MFASLLLWFGLAAQGQVPPSTFHLTGRHEERTAGLDCASDPCGAVLPGAVRFEPIPSKPYVLGVNAEGDAVGWVALSSQIVDVKAYSGKPLFTLVGLDTTGTIVGARVVHHSEPILLVGIPEAKLHAFVNKYVGLKANEKVVVGGTAPGARSIDIVSGATVTVLAENQTLLETARRVGEDVGVIAAMGTVEGHFTEDSPWSWRELVASGALGHLRVEQDAMGLPPDAEGRPFVELWFGLVDAPQVGVPLLGEGTYRWAMGKRPDGDHLFVVFNGGAYSFKGSGFVRGGIFDRFHVEQGLDSLSFMDMDYTKLDTPKAEGAPNLWEGGLYFAKGEALNPGLSYDFVFLGSKPALERGAFERDFQTFSAHHRTPANVYVLEGPDPEAEAAARIWKAAWAQGWPKALFVGLYLAMVGGLFAGRSWLTARMKRLKRVHSAVLLTSFVVLGVVLHVQPSVTQLLTLAGSVTGEWRWGLFLSDPVLFVSWVFIALFTFAWGRGVFCGWVCPYGAMNELAYKLGRKLGLPDLELPDRVHFKARYLRYGLFAALLAAFLYDAQLGERLAEVEPFKSTFFVPIWTRHPGFIVWWTTLFVASFTTYRPFCRYICPLGAALAVPSSLRASGPYRRGFCSKCKICTKGCEPRAIRSDGMIDPRECLNCWECEANWRDEQVCPPLVRDRRAAEKQAVDL